MTVDGLASSEAFDAAVAAALSEMGETEPIVPDPTLSVGDGEDGPVADDAPPPAAGPENEDPEAPEEFDFVVPAAPEGGSAPKALKDDTLVVLPGRAEPITFGELVKGQLRLDDYTRKTQEVAEMRRQLEAQMTAEDRGNAELWEAMTSDPLGTIRYLARHLGADDVEQGLAGLQNVGFVPRHQVDQFIAQEVQRAVAQHPQVQAAARARFQQEMTSAWQRIESKVGQPLSEQAKVKVMNFAAENGIANVEVAFDALRARMGTKTPAQQNLAATKPQKRQALAREGENPPAPKDAVLDFDQSVEAALAEIDAMSEV